MNHTPFARGRSKRGRQLCAFLLVYAGMAAGLWAQSTTLTALYSFCAQGGTVCTDGSLPYAGLLQATDGNFYGTTYSGGANASGTVYAVTPGGALTTLYSFCSQSNCADGRNPYAGLVQAMDGNVYGTTYSGGNFNDGTVFKSSLSGSLTTLFSFCAGRSFAPAATTLTRRSSRPQMGISMGQLLLVMLMPLFSKSPQPASKAQSHPSAVAW